MENKRGSSIAVRSDAIIEARFSLTAKQNELLDMLLCEIENDNQNKYVISVDKYKEFYQTDTSNLYRDLKKAVKGFEGKGFRIINKETGEEIYYAWFSKIHYKPKLGEIVVSIDLDFKRLLWEVKKKIYYDIRYTLNFKSQYSQRMYYYLKSFEDTGWRIDTFESLLYKLECPKSYSVYNDFRKYVLEVAKKELNKTSDISFKFTPIKTKRKVTSIKFTITSKKKVFSKAKNTDNSSYLISQVRDFIKEDLLDKDILKLLELANNDINIIKAKYNIMLKQKKVFNVSKWLESAIQNDYKISSYEQISYFNNYEQRPFDPTLENKLLGWTND